MKKEQDIRHKTIEDIAAKMMAAARTAPKAKGIDTLEIAVADKNDIEKIAARMKEIANDKNLPGFVRDAENILKAEAMVLIGTRIKTIGLVYCGLCGFLNCTEKQNHPEHPCAFNTGDLGIAIGSAVSVAMDARIDNRIMYSVGMAVRELGMMDADVKIIYGIPLSCTSKNIFFDRG
ncbi:MAG: ferredoxin [Bacteroidales bacterium]|nr:ferredoxin [Bacteroidales bacterium]